MVTTISQNKWTIRLTTLAVWALAAGCLGFWGLRLSASPSFSPLSKEVAAVKFDSPALARILGANSAQAVEATPLVSLASRFALQGVVAGAPNGGAALIAVDGKPARPFRIGSSIEDGLLLQSTNGRQVVLSATTSGPALVTLEMPLLKQ
jgi:general secretion pathway protein C